MYSNIVVKTIDLQDSLDKIAWVDSNNPKCSYILYWRIPDTRHSKQVFSFYTSYFEFLYLYYIYNIPTLYIYRVKVKESSGTTSYWEKRWNMITSCNSELWEIQTWPCVILYMPTISNICILSLTNVYTQWFILFPLNTYRTF